MDDSSLDLLREFENSAKKEIIIKYNSALPKEKVDFVLQKEYVTDDYLEKKKDDKKRHGELIRSIFADLINSNDNSDLVHSLVEYYTINFAEKNNIDINDRPDLKGKLKAIIKEEKKLGNDLNIMAFNDQYLNIINNDENNNMETPSIKLVYKNNEQYIEYFENNEKYSIKSENPKKVSTLYKKLIKNNVDPKEIFNQLNNVVNESQNTSEEVNMLDFINNNNTDNSIDNSFEEISDNIKDNFDELIEEAQPLTNDDVKDENNELSMPSEFDNYNHENNNENELETNNDYDNLLVNSETIENVSSINDLDENDIITDFEEENNNYVENEAFEKIDDEYNAEQNNLEDIKSFRETLDDNSENNNLELEKEENDRKNDIYMIFYIFAVIISIALIIGIIFLKFYS